MFSVKYGLSSRVMLVSCSIKTEWSPLLGTDRHTGSHRKTHTGTHSLYDMCMLVQAHTHTCNHADTETHRKKQTGTIT